MGTRERKEEKKGHKTFNVFQGDRLGVGGNQDTVREAQKKEK